MQSRGLDGVWFLCPWRGRKVVKPLKPNRQQQRAPTLHRLNQQLRKVFIGGEEIDTQHTYRETDPMQSGGETQEAKKHSPFSGFLHPLKRLLDLI